MPAKVQQRCHRASTQSPTKWQRTSLPSCNRKVPCTLRSGRSRTERRDTECLRRWRKRNRPLAHQRVSPRVARLPAARVERDRRGGMRRNGCGVGRWWVFLLAGGRDKTIRTRSGASPKISFAIGDITSLTDTTPEVDRSRALAQFRRPTLRRPRPTGEDRPTPTCARRLDGASAETNRRTELRAPSLLLLESR